MARFLVRRVLQMIPTLFGVSVAIFLFVRMIPGDPAVVMAGPNATAAVIAALRIQMGLNQPLPVQFAYYIGGLLHGNLGRSLVSQVPVTHLIAIHFMPTFELAVWGMVLAVVLGILAGVVSAVRRNSRLDYSVMTASMMGISFPSFWLGMGLIAIFAVSFHLVPAEGNVGWSSYILPSVTLGTAGAAAIARFTRQSMVATLTSDYIRTARSKGLRETVVVMRHAVKNALAPVITVVGLQFGFLLGGSIVVEDVFSWPGLGNLLIQSVESRDYSTVQALMLLFTLEFIVASLLVDVTYAVVDPRIRYE